MVLAYFAKQERRENHGQLHLRGSRKVAARAIGVKGHHAQRDILFAQHVPNLPQHFLDANIRARIARAVISREKKFQFLARLPGAARAKFPKRAGEFNV